MGQTEGQKIRWPKEPDLLAACITICKYLKRSLFENHFYLNMVKWETFVEDLIPKLQNM